MSNNVLIVLPNDHLGGAEQYLKMVAEYLSKEGYNIHVFFLKEKSAKAWNSLENERFKLVFTKFKSEKFGILGVFKNLLRFRNIQYEYIFTSHVHVNSYISLLRKIGIVKARYHIARESTSVFHRYTGVSLFLFKILYLIGYKRIDLLISQTQFMHDQLFESLPNLFKDIRAKVIPNPIKIKESTAITISKNFAFDNFIVSAGRLIHEKGYDLLINAFKLLHEDNANLHLVILGEGKMRGALEVQIENLNLKNYVHLVGFVSDVYPYFRKAKMCVVSSRIEGFPNVLLQMMHENDKVVSTLCAGGIDEIKGVVTCEVNNEKALYQVMKKTLLSNNSNRAYFDIELRNRSIENFINKVRHYLSEKI